MTVLRRHHVREVQSLINKWPVHHKPGVVEAGAQLCGHDVQVVHVTGRYLTLISAEERLARPLGRHVCCWEVDYVFVIPLQRPGQ